MGLPAAGEVDRGGGVLSHRLSARGVVCLAKPDRPLRLEAAGEKRCRHGRVGAFSIMKRCGVLFLFWIWRCIDIGVPHPRPSVCFRTVKWVTLEF